MALPKLFNRVRMSVSGTPGTGNVSLGSAIQTSTKGYHQSFASAGAANGDTVIVVFEDGTAWEISQVTYSTTGPALNSRTLIASSTGSLLSLTSAAEVFAAVDASFFKSRILYDDIFTITDGASVDIDPANGGIQLWTLGANRTPSASNFDNGQSVVLMVDDGTARTLTWTTIGVTWLTDSGSAPTLKTTGYTAIVLTKIGGTVYGWRAGDGG